MLPGETDPTVLAGPSPLRVVWTPYRAPVDAVVKFERHESTPDVEPRPLAGWKYDGPDCYSAMPCAELDDAQLVDVPSGEGTVRVLATFSEPGEYWVLVQANNWGRPDSGFGDQCCHGNGYLRVSVEP